MTLAPPPQIDTSLGPASLRELSQWRPPMGVLSVYIDIDPADRGASWKIELRNELRRMVSETAHDAHERRAALRETATRIEHEAEDVGEAPRGLAAFIEISEEPGAERTFATHLHGWHTAVRHGQRAWLSPLIAMLDEGGPAGVAAVSSERVRLFDWRLGRLEELADWRLELYLDDWRERKAQRPADPASSQAVSSSGHDQHDQRLDANRDRFADDAGRLAAERAGEHDWREVIVLGDQRYAERFAGGFGERPPVRIGDHVDVVSEPSGRIGERIVTLIPSLRAKREGELIGQLDEAAYAEGRASFGRAETMQALEQGRVDNLIYRADRDGIETEQMIELAIATAARITPVGDGDAAAKLESHGGVAALLRY